MDPGEVVDEETILRIAQIDPLRVEVILPAGTFGHVQPGERAEVVPEPPLDQPRAAEVAIVDPVSDGASGTFGARLLLPNPDRRLPAGLRCQVRFIEDSQSAPRDLAADGFVSSSTRPHHPAAIPWYHDQGDLLEPFGTGQNSRNRLRTRPRTGRHLPRTRWPRRRLTTWAPSATTWATRCVRPSTGDPIPSANLRMATQESDRV